MRVVYQHPFATLEAHPGPGGHDWIRIRMPDWVNVVPITADGQVVLVRQPRFGTGLSHLETPGGLVDRGELPADAARRELLEETGYEAARWRRLLDAYTTPGLADEWFTLFLATGLKKVADGGGDEHERITIHLAPLDRFDREIEALRDDGCGVDVKVYLAAALAKGMSNAE